MSIVVGRAPGRASFVGGGTDLPAYFERHGGAVVSAALAMYSYAQASTRTSDLELVSLDTGSREVVTPDHFTRRMRPPIIAQEYLTFQKAVAWHFGIERGRLAVSSEVPFGAGLGSSASVCVALVTAAAQFVGETLSRAQIAEAACRVEMNVLRRPVGKQDPYAAAFGGVNLIEFERDASVHVTPLRMSPETIAALRRRLLVFHNGSRRNATPILEEQARRTQSDPATIAALGELKAMAHELRELLESGRLDEAGELIGRGWQRKRLLSSQSTTGAIDRLYVLARDAGALGGKLLGAGLAGALLLFCAEGAQDEVRRTLATQGWRERPAAFDFDGARLCAEVGSTATV